MIPDLVSVIIPTYNRKKIIGKTVDCALEQTYSKIEVIVVDNASVDGTYEVLQERYGKNEQVKIYRNETNLGPVKNWEKCLDYAEGEFCKIQWSDDFMEPDFIERAVKVLKEEKDVAFVYSKVALVRIGAVRKCGNIFYALGNTGKYDKEVFVKNAYWKSGCARFTRCALFRTRDIIIAKEIPNQFGIDYLSTGAGPDILIYLFATVNYKYVYYIDEVLNIFGVHGGSISCSGIDLFYSYLTAKLYFVSEIMPNKEYQNFLIEDVIFHCMQDAKTCKETYRIVKKCDHMISLGRFIASYRKKMYDMMR